MSRQFFRCSAVAVCNRGNQANGTDISRPSARTTRKRFLRAGHLQRLYINGSRLLKNGCGRRVWPFANSDAGRSCLRRNFLALKASRAKGQPPQAVAAARGRLRRRRSSPMRPGIALVAPPCIRPRGARNAASHPFSAACWCSCHLSSRRLRCSSTIRWISEISMLRNPRDRARNTGLTRISGAWCGDGMREIRLQCAAWIPEGRCVLRNEGTRNT